VKVYVPPRASTSVLFLTRHNDLGGKSLNKWYDQFGLLAVLSDVTIIVIGFLIANFIYPFIFSKYSLGLFLGVTVLVQMLHDILFYFFVIKPFPKGLNTMMDVFKDYAASGGAKILVGDALMMAGSGLLAMSLKSWPTHIVAGFGSLVAYALPYILYTRNIFTVLR